MAEGPRRQVARYADAARRMRLRQLAARPRRLLPPAVLAAGIRSAAPPAWTPLAEGLFVDRAPQSGPQPPPHLDGTFRAVGAQRSFESWGPFWSVQDDGLLFAFCLHGFADLCAYAAGEADPDGDRFWDGVLRSWLTECGRPSRVAWHPFPTSARILAWCSALSRGGWDPALEARMLQSLWTQARVLVRSVEHDIGGNHVLHNLIALAVAGRSLGAPAMGDRALRALRHELGRQILPDGGHEERAPSYHRHVLHQLEDLGVLLARAGADTPAWLGSAVDRMSAFAAAVAGPDGRLPLLNDGWEGPPVSRPSSLSPVSDLADSGYLVLRHGADQAVFDVGPLGPAHLPAHVHADALSFVAWADGTPVVVDPGSFAYAGPERDRFRATAAHNTVEVDGTDQCDFWGPFRAASRPSVRRLRLDVDGSAIVACAEHDGYGVVHRRTLAWLPGDGLVVVDRLVGTGRHRVRSRPHLAPGLESPGPLRVTTLDGGDPAATDGSYSSHLGVREPIRVLEQAREVAAGDVFGWLLLRGGGTVEIAPGAARIRRPAHPEVRVPLD